MREVVADLQVRRRGQSTGDARGRRALREAGGAFVGQGDRVQSVQGDDGSGRRDELVFGTQPAQRGRMRALPGSGAVRISSEYGKRRNPKRRSTYRLHHGVDIRAPQGSPALAFKGGTVIRANRFSSYGLTVEIRQYDGMVARYAHLNKILIKRAKR